MSGSTAHDDKSFTTHDASESATLHDPNWSPTRGSGSKEAKSLDVEKKSTPDMSSPPDANASKPPSKFLFWKKSAKGAVSAVAVDPPRDQMGVFELAPSTLKALVDPKSVDHLTSLGGMQGLESKLHTSFQDGLSESADPKTSLDTRRAIYLSNKLDARDTKSLFRLMWDAFTDKILIMLTVAAIVSLALGIYQAVGTDPEIVNGQKEPQVQWVEGVAIIVAIVIVVLVGALNDYQKELQFKKLNAQKEERFVKVYRNGGAEKMLNVHDIVVGDVLSIEPGEIIPVDGVFISGHNVRCDESSTTGESDAIRKSTYAELMAPGQHDKKADCFVLSGSKVLEGGGKYVAIAVGKHSILGGIMTSLTGSGSTDSTPLQIKLNHLADMIAKLGLTSGLVLFVALMIRYFVQLATISGRTADEKAQSFIKILIIAVTIIVVAVPEGLPLAVTLALAFATKRMTKQNLLVRVLSSCETMANTTVVCTDKTGTLTQNVMTVVAGSVGVHLKFADRIAENKGRSNANDDVDEQGAPVAASTEGDATVPPRRKGRMDFSMDMQEINTALNNGLRQLLNEAIAVNSTAFEGEDEKGQVTFIGSKTETALLSFAKNQGWTPYKQVRDTADIVQVFPFSSSRKCSGVLLRLPNGRVRLHVKGASEILQRLSTKHVYVANPRSGSFSEADQAQEAVRELDFTAETRSNVERSIIFYANQSLRTIGICYREFPQWPMPGLELNEDNEVKFEDICQDLTLLGITAIEDPLRPGVREAVAQCLAAGVQVKMCTGDNVLTARSIATQCGIFTPGGVIMEGPHFRTLSDQELVDVLPRLQILARSSPQDKERLVRHLKAEPLREIVGVTGDGMNDAPALKEANVGFAMGIAGTEVAKEASDIVLMDDNFSSIVTAIIWGRCVNDSVRKFLQFQLAVNICAVLLTFITAVASTSEESVLTAVQLLWVNLIMDTFAALALATDPATPEVLKRRPDRITAPLINTEMWKMIFGQSMYQLIVALVLHWAGPYIFNTHSSDPLTQQKNNQKLSTLIFNQFVFCQIFNMLNCRVLGRKLWVLNGVFKNPWFLAIFVIMVGGQAIIAEVGGAAFSVTRINGIYWAVSIVIGFLCMPWAVLIRLIPTEPCAVFFAFWAGILASIWNFFGSIMKPFHRKKKDSVLPTEAPEKLYGVPLVLDNLKVLSAVRGGRTRSSSIVKRSRTKQLEAHDIRTSQLMAIVPSLVFSSIGAGWNKDNSGIGSLSDPAAEDPSQSSTALWTGQALTHPSTPADDPIRIKYGDVKPSSPTLSPKSKGGRHSRSPSTSSRLSGSLAEDVIEEEPTTTAKTTADGLLKP